MLTYTEALKVLEALRRLYRYFPTDGDMRRAGWDGLVIERACLACDDARDAAAFLYSRMENPQDGWQPIETAPTDGTRILVLCAHGGIEVSEWYEIWLVRYEDAGNGLYRMVREKTTSGWNGNHPTHWQPLPPPPSQDHTESIDAEGEKK